MLHKDKVEEMKVFKVNWKETKLKKFILIFLFEISAFRAPNTSVLNDSSTINSGKWN